MYNVYPQQQQFAMYQPQRVAAMTQGLTKEQQEELRNQVSSSFNLKVDQIELNKAACTHKYNGQYDYIVIDQSTNLVECKTCHERFHLVDDTQEDVEEIVNRVIDIMQTDKTLYLDMNPVIARDYFTLIPLLKKLPQLHKAAKDNFEAYNATMNFQNQNELMGFNQYNQIISPYGGYGYMPQPTYGMQPMMGQPQMMNPAMGQPMMGQPQQMMDPAMGQQMMGMPPAVYAAQGQNPFIGYGTQMYPGQNMQQPVYNNQAPQQPVNNNQAPQQQPAQNGANDVTVAKVFQA